MFLTDNVTALAKQIPHEGFQWQHDGSAITMICRQTRDHLQTMGVVCTPDVLTGVLLVLADMYGWDAPNMGPGTEAAFYRFIAEHV